MAQVGLVDHIEGEVDDAHEDKHRQQAQQHGGDVVLPKSFGTLDAVSLHWFLWVFWSGKITIILLRLGCFCEAKVKWRHVLIVFVSD